MGSSGSVLPAVERLPLLLLLLLLLLPLPVDPFPVPCDDPLIPSTELLGCKVGAIRVLVVVSVCGKSEEGRCDAVVDVCFPSRA